jgi:Arc/MetJ-type ribon-helix-helix transcriptional regulator
MVSFEGKPKTEYIKINLPKPMVEEITRIISSDERLGFVSIQEFVKEGVRKSIVEYGGSLNGNDRDSIGK